MLRSLVGSEMCIRDRFQKLLVLEVVISIFLGVVDGIKIQQYCMILSFIHLIFFAIQLITLFVTRPYGTMVSLAVMGLMSIGNAAAALFGGVASVLESKQFSAAEEPEDESPMYEKVRMVAMILCAVVPILVVLKLILDVITLLRCCSRGNYKDGIVNEGLQYSSNGGIITGGSGDPRSSSANLTGPLLVVTTGGNGSNKNKNPSSSYEVVDTPPIGTVFAGGGGVTSSSPKTQQQQEEIITLPPPPKKKKMVIKTVTKTLRKPEKGDDQEEMEPVEPIEPIAEDSGAVQGEDDDLLGGGDCGEEDDEEFKDEDTTSTTATPVDEEDDGGFSVNDDDI
eukprot:TRINITY_DN7559_c0_g2_i4.p1 TRINITY_DN7559_c0_g2~~TRINITY_DN7559_c0_g2_i4.p1  ORF type:complete len:338 (+),score=84.61 TRINITY_DN7559_c0_g2_i4:95-1108(+)